MSFFLARRGTLLRGLGVSVVLTGLLILAWHLLGQKVAWQGIHLTAYGTGLAALGAMGFLLGRAWRFWSLLPKQVGSKRELLGVTAASWGAGLLLPGPSADLSFVALARMRLGVGVGRAMGSAVIARILDVVSLAAIALVASSLAGSIPLAVRLVAAGAGLAGILVLLVMILPYFREGVAGLLGRIPKIADLAERTESELSELNSPGRWVSLVASTMFCRGATVVQYAALISMVGLQLGFWQVWFVLAIRTLLLTIPIQGLAGIGTGQAWWAGALLLEGVGAGTAVAVGLTLQVLDLAISLPIAGVASGLVWRSGEKREVPVPLAAGGGPESELSG